jgi:GTP cyclohydrolase-4
MSRFRRAIDAMPEGLDPHRFAVALGEELLRRHTYATSADVVVQTEALVGDIVLPLTARAHLGEVVTPSAAAPSSVSMTVLGSTVCPCSFAMSGDRYAHVQRAELRVDLTEPKVTAAELHFLCSQAFSAPVAMVLDRPAEKALVDRMFAHPRFVEDVAREAVNNLSLRRAGTHARVVATAFESIHPYDCYAQWEGSL